MSLLPIAVSVLAIVLVSFLAILVALLRQNGRLLLRVDALEAKVGPAGHDEPGLPKDTPAPAFTLSGLDGESVTLDSLVAQAKPVLLIFAEPGCSACETLFPDVAQWQQDHDARLSIIMVSTGKIAANRNRRDRNQLRHVLLQKDREVAQAYRASVTPAAVLIRDGRIASVLAEGPDDVRSLVVRANLPPALTIGNRVPSLELDDLDGHALDLSSLRGKKTLLLFWDSNHAHCQFMAPDVRTHERLRPADSPDFLIVASGPSTLTRAQKFQSRVLVDPHKAGRALFGAEYVPAAVLIDEEGRVASELAVGYIPAFELIGLVPYVPSKDATVEAMLKLANIQQSDVVYDLGCGDGRIVIGAARTYGARGVGVDINPERLAEGRANAALAAVEHLVRFEERSVAEIDFREATVVTLYLLPKVNMELRPRLLTELKPGTRVVSHGFDMDDWKPQRQIEVNGDTIYLWTIPG